MMGKADLLTASSEILDLSKLIPNHIDEAKRQSVVTYLVSLDYLVKGIYTHWLVKLQEENKQVDNSDFMQKLDIKYPILIGDQF